MKPYFSIIIPTLNEEKFLPKLLGDLVKQKEKNFEIIIVDAVSQDKTKELAQGFKQLPLKFYTVNKKSVSYQRNFGARNAQADYLVFIDADSRVFPSFTSSLKKIIINEKGLVFIPYIIPAEDDPQLRILFNFTNILIEFSQLTSKPFSSGGSMIWKKEFFDLVGGFEEKIFIAEDHNIIQKAFIWGVRAKFLKKIKVKFSLRRINREGQLKIFYKYLLATAHIIFKGKVDKKLFDYDMGGSKYPELIRKLPSNDSFTRYFQLIKKFLKNI